MTEDEMLQDAVGRIDERASALAAFHKLPGLEYLAGLAVTLDGAFDVGAAFMFGQDDAVDETIVELFAEAYAAALSAGLAMCDVPDEKRETVLADLQAIVQERRDLQNKLCDGGQG